MAYDPATASWRTIADGPIGSLGEEPASWVWTGDELVIWVRQTAAAWDPDTDTWRALGDWPLQPSSPRRAVWTGEEILDVDAGVAVDPVTGASRRIATPPSLPEGSGVVLADGRVVVVPDRGVYDLATDTWRQPRPSGLRSVAAAGTWTDESVVAVDYEMRAAEIDPAAGEWTLLPALPLRFYECAPQALSIGDVPFMALCSGNAVWEDTDGGWIPIAAPTPRGGITYVAAPEALYAWDGAAMYELQPGSLPPDADPRRLPIGNSLLDLPEGWRFTDAVGAGPGGDAYVRDTVSITGNGHCTLAAVNGDIGVYLRRQLDDAVGTVSFRYDVGGAPVEALAIRPHATSDLHRLVWATGVTDLVDVGCTDPEDTLIIARATWSPWQ